MRLRKPSTQEASAPPRKPQEGLIRIPYGLVSLQPSAVSRQRPTRGPRRYSPVFYVAIVRHRFHFNATFPSSPPLRAGWPSEARSGWGKRQSPTMAHDCCLGASPLPSATLRAAATANPSGFDPSRGRNSELHGFQVVSQTTATEHRRGRCPVRTERATAGQEFERSVAASDKLTRNPNRLPMKPLPVPLGTVCPC